MSDNKDIEIPSFMNNSSRNSERRPRRMTSQERADILEVDFQRTKEQSRNQEVIHAKKSRKKVSKMSQAKKMGIAFSLGVGVTLGVIGALNKDNIMDIPENWKEQQIADEYLSDLYDVIHDNTHHNSNGYWYDTADISTTFREMIRNGVPEEAVAYVTANGLDYVYELDERDAVFYSLFDATPDEWAKQHGYDSIEDKDLKKDVKRNIIRSEKANEYNQSLTSMLEDNANQMASNVKGLGGK